MASVFTLSQVAGAIAQSFGVPQGLSYAPTYAATVAIDPTVQSPVVTINTTSAVGNATLTTASAGPLGQFLIIQINNDAGGARTITFSTGFRATGTVVGTASKAFCLIFISDGITFNEYCRSASALT